MGEHRAPDSLAVIGQLRDLGEALGYDALTEVALKTPGSAGQAIDVVWYGAGSTSAPLFIFEVETAARREMGANAQKVLAKRTSDLFKPLFMFQILVRGGGDSPTSADLKSAFGSLNYRLLDLSAEGPEVLLREILVQHRRITNDLGLFEVLMVCRAQPFSAASVAVDIVHELEFSCDPLQDVSRAAFVHRDLLPQVRSVAERRKVVRDRFGQETFNYHWRSYLGMFAWDRLEPLLLSLIDPSSAEAARQSIGGLPDREDLGLSRDWDETVLGAGPAMWGVSWNMPWSRLYA